MIYGDESERYLFLTASFTLSNDDKANSCCNNYIYPIIQNIKRSKAAYNVPYLNNVFTFR